MYLSGKLKMIPRLYHFTDQSNLASIQETGLLATALLKDQSIVYRPSGNPVSLQLDEARGMDRYVHLCFLQKHPMEFRACEDGRIEKTAWIRVSSSVLELPGVLFCPGVANANEAKLIPMAEAGELIDYQALYTHMDWKVPEFGDRHRAAVKSEILVPDYVSTDFLEGL